MSERRFESFAEFWPFYLGEHSLAATRWLHFFGSTLAVATAISAIATGRLWLLVLSPPSGYAFAWFSHFFIEKNRPASFKHPLWSLKADWLMWSMMLTGRLDKELARLGIAPRAENAAA